MSKSYIPKSVKQQVQQTSKNYCEYCLMPADYSPASFTFDHIFPESLGGKSNFDNIALACGSCNRNKYDKVSFLDETTNQETRLYHPRKDNWYEHFKWDETETKIVDLTPTGRVTIELLQINRESNINQRSLLRLVGLYPPIDYPPKSTS